MSERKIIQEQNCPRCNARAFLRVELERGDICFVYTICNKCKLRKYQFMTTKKAIRLLTVRDSLSKKLSEAVSEAYKANLRRRLTDVERQIRESNTAMGVK